MISYPCPACGGDAVLCFCGALPLEDQRRIIKALQADFPNIIYAMAIADVTSKNHNLLHVAAMEYIYVHSSEEFREAFNINPNGVQ